MLEGPNHNAEFLTSQLTSVDTTLQDRIDAAAQLFPFERKREKLSAADIDSKNRPVRYFRLLTYEELRAVLAASESQPLIHPATDAMFFEKTEEIKRALKSFLIEEGIHDEFYEEFENLTSNFTLLNFQNFVQGRLPRIKLFKLHVGSECGNYPGITGLYSLSVGAPYQSPYNPSDTRRTHKEGLPVVEFSIPADEVFVHPLFKSMNLEMEKEVNTLNVKPEWMIDVYNGTEDFAERFIKDPASVLHQEYLDLRSKGAFVTDYISEARILDMLQHWKNKESIADLIPAQKRQDIDEDDPKLQLPLSAIFR